MIKRRLSNLGVVTSKPMCSLFYFYRRFRGKFRNDDYYKNGILSAPSSVYINITGLCNYKCPGCHVVYESRDKYSKLKEEELNTSEWKDIISDISRFKPFIYIVGGEPLLRKDILEIISHISKCGCISSIVTNGSLLSTDKCHKLIDAGLNFITISLDGSKATHSKSRGMKNAFEKTFKGIENMNNSVNKRLIPTIKIRINCVINEFNFGDIDSFKFVVSLREKFKMINYIDFIPNSFFTDKMIKLDSCKYQPIGYRLEAAAQQNIIEKGEIFIPQLLSLVEENKSFCRITAVSNESNLKAWFSDYIPNLSSLSCSHIKQDAVIYSTGDVSHCLGEILGNVKQNNFLDIYNGQKAVAFRKKLISKKSLECIRCCSLSNFTK